MKKYKGISLIVLIITIIVVIIIAGAIVLNLNKNNPIFESREAKFKANIDSYKSELSLLLYSMYAKDPNFSANDLDAGLWDESKGNTSGTVKEYITSMTSTDGPNFEIQDGNLVYVGSNTDESKWALETGIKLSGSILSEKIVPENSTITLAAVTDGKATLTLASQDKESGIQKVELYQNDNILKVYNYDMLDLNIHNESIEVVLPFYESENFKINSIDYAGNVATSEVISSMNKDIVNTTADLIKLSTIVNTSIDNFSGKTIKLNSNLNLNCTQDNQWIPISDSTHSFLGTFDGNNKTITGIYINNTSSNQGLFGFNQGTIKN